MKINIQFAEMNSKMKVKHLLGLTFPNGKHIYIQKGLSKKKTFEVFIHELTHAVMLILHIKKSDANHERIALKVGRYARRLVFKD